MTLGDIKKMLAGAAASPLECLRDSSRLPKGFPQPSFARLCRETLRYRAASMGLFLTENEKRLASFKDRFRGQRAFIMGNGPSLNMCDLTLLKDEVTFAANSIFLNYDKMGFHPTFYVVEDLLVAEDRRVEIDGYRGPTRFFGNYLDYCLSGSPDTVWLNVRFRYDEYPGFPHFSRNALRMLWVGGTVSYLALQLAYYMGFSTVYLIGFDHSYTIPKDAEISGARILSTGDDPNHFHPGYFGKGYRWHDPQVDRMERAYLRAKEAYEADGRNIYNASCGGRLEVFPRVDYRGLFG